MPPGKIKYTVDFDRIRENFGEFVPIKQSVIDMVHSMAENGLVEKKF